MRWLICLVLPFAACEMVDSEPLDEATLSQMLSDGGPVVCSGTPALSAQDLIALGCKGCSVTTSGSGGGATGIYDMQVRTNLSYNNTFWAAKCVVPAGFPLANGEYGVEFPQIPLNHYDDFSIHWTCKIGSWTHDPPKKQASWTIAQGTRNLPVGKLTYHVEQRWNPMTFQVVYKLEEGTQENQSTDTTTGKTEKYRCYSKREENGEGTGPVWLETLDLSVSTPGTGSGTVATSNTYDSRGAGLYSDSKSYNYSLSNKVTGLVSLNKAYSESYYRMGLSDPMSASSLDQTDYAAYRSWAVRSKQTTNHKNCRGAVCTSTNRVLNYLTGGLGGLVKDEAVDFNRTTDAGLTLESYSRLTAFDPTFPTRPFSETITKNNIRQLDAKWGFYFTYWQVINMAQAAFETAARDLCYSERIILGADAGSYCLSGFRY